MRIEKTACDFGLRKTGNAEYLAGPLGDLAGKRLLDGGTTVDGTLEFHLRGIIPVCAQLDVTGPMTAVEADAIPGTAIAMPARTPAPPAASVIRRIPDLIFMFSSP
jgi:hypothetical protein